VATEDDEDDGVGGGLGPIGDAEIDGIETEQIGFDCSAKALVTASGLLEVVAIVAATAVVLVGVGAALHTSTHLSGNQAHPDLGSRSHNHHQWRHLRRLLLGACSR
jgi:hypothetical protein